MDWNELLDHFARKSEQWQSLIEDMKSEDELMSFLWADEESINFLSSWLENCNDKKQSKSIEKAKMFKTIGNKEFQDKNYALSIKWYTKCASHAPIDCEDLSIAIANRSASLFHLNKYNDCMKDLEFAMRFNYPKKLHYKLHLRAAQCYLKLGKKKSAKKKLSKLREIMNDPEYVLPSIREDINKQISKLALIGPSAKDEEKELNDLGRLIVESCLTFKENPNFPFASINLSKKHNKMTGTYVVANKFIEKGEILFLEMPASFVVLEKSEDDAQNQLCHYCCSSIATAPIPCTTCLNTFYCDIECSDKAWSSYHRWECPGCQMDLWKKIGTGHLAAKLLLTCTTATEKTRSREVANLKTNFDKLDAESLTLYGITAVMLTIYLFKYTDYFKVRNLEEFIEKNSENTFNFCDVSTDYGKQLYVGSVLLRHILQLICNAHSIKSSCIKSDVVEQNIIATGIYPAASMMNHSCDPTIVNIFTQSCLIVKAARDIEEGEQIFNTYGPHFRYMPQEDRQDILTSQYHFTCKCKPCTDTELKYFAERFDSFLCLKCEGALCDVGDNLRCLHCNYKIDHENHDILSKLKQGYELFEAAEKSLKENNKDDALNKLKECLNIRETVLYQYHSDIAATLNLMEKVYIAKGYWEKSISCRQRTVFTTIMRYGFTSLEYLNEMLALAKLYIGCTCAFQEDEFMSRLDNDVYSYTFEKFTECLEELIDVADLRLGSWSTIYKKLVDIKPDGLNPYT